MAGLFTRTGWLLPLLFISFIVSVLYSLPIWWLTSTDFFPPIPAISWLENLPKAIDNALFILWVLFLVTGIVKTPKQRWFPVVTLLLFVWLCINHVSRIQPWSIFFMGSWIILLSENKNRQNALLVFTSGIYLWTGIFKLGPWYQKNVAAEIDLTITQYFGDGFISNVLHILSAVLPYLFIAFILLAFIPRLRKWIGAFFMVYHLVVLLILSVWRNNPNYVIWPWNFSLVFFWIFQMATQKREPVKTVFKNKLVLICVVWVFLYPLTWFMGRTSSTACMHVYSGLHREAYLPFGTVNRPNTAIWMNEKLYYSVGLDYTQTCGVPFPDSPQNILYVWKRITQKESDILIYDYHLTGTYKVIKASR